MNSRKPSPLAAAALRAIAKPTAAQAEAGNYRKAHVTIHGLDIAIECRKGQRRQPQWPPLAAHYGYVKRTLGRDGDHVDIFVGPDTASELVVVIDQVNQGGKFDEHKCLIGFATTADAIETYRKCYTPGWKVGPVTTMTIDQFKAWLKDGNQTKPIADQVSRYQANRNTLPLEANMPTLAERFAAAFAEPIPESQPPTLTDRFAAAFAGVTVEQYAARRAKNSPGQLGLFGDGLGGDRPLRTAAKQQRLQWDK